VPAGLAAVVARMMAKDPARRYQQPAEVAQALAPFITTGLGPLPGVAAPPPNARPQAPSLSVRVATQDSSQDKYKTVVPAPLVSSRLTEGKATTGAPEKRAGAGKDWTPGAGGSRKWRGVLAGGVVVLLLAGAIGLWAGGAFSPKVGDRPSAPSGDGQTRPGDPKAVDGDVVARVKKGAGIELVSIPAGEFLMGSGKDDKDAHDDEKPQHKVRITRPFYLGKTKVTVGQFRRFVEATGHTTEAEKAGDKWTWKKPGSRNSAFDQTNEHPVVYLSWNDADAFCQWLAKQTGATVRLPYEAEWEYSCRAKTTAGPTTKFYFGDNEADLRDYAWYDKNAGSGTRPCGRKKPNDFGLYDMHGLTWEWCADGRRKYEAQDETDPVGPTRAGASRMCRGGSWFFAPPRCRAALRGGLAPSDRCDFSGFRVLVER
jgi:formylglycine-generating enzyme required for sulfatase activity